jgi:hypothetical protein
VTAPASTRGAGTSYARVTRQYIPAAFMLVLLAVGISAARRAVAPDIDTLLGDVLEAVVLAAIAITLIGITIVRPFERRMHERRRAAAERERAYRLETERREFERRVAAGLELCETEVDLLVTTRRAMLEATGGAPAELLIAHRERESLDRAVVTGDDAPSCPVQSREACPATRRGVVQTFEDSESLDACPMLRGRPQGRIGAVCAPVAITGRTLGVVHAVHEPGVAPSRQVVEQLVALADHVGARIGVLRLTAAASSGASHLVDWAPVARASGHGAADERSAVAGTEPAGDAGDHEVSGVGAAPAAEGAEGGADRAMERDLLGRVE